MSKPDLIDRRILAELLRDAAQPVAQIAERVGLSQTPCWKRIRSIASDGGLPFAALPRHLLISKKRPSPCNTSHAGSEKAPAGGGTTATRR